MKYVGSGFSRTCLLALVTISLVAIDLRVSAQLAPPNAAGVSMGYLHFRVKDVEATRKFWLALGGRIAKAPGTVNNIVFPDVIVMLTQGASSGGSDGSVVNHVAFRVRTFSEVEAAGFTVQRLQQFPGVGSITTPDGERIELFENAATNLTFTPDVGPIDDVAARHNRPLTGPIAFHHIHLNVPAGEVAAAKAWYARAFGGTPGKRSNYDAVDLPGVNINISAAAKPVSGTRGRALDQIGFAVADVDAFGKRLQEMNFGRDLDSVWGPVRGGDGETITITDPWGTAIAMGQGLRRY